MSTPRVPRRSSSPWFALVCLLAGSGCAAVRAGVQVQDAQSARDEAIEQGASTVSIYEFTMAERYLEKAWEEMGTGAYKSSVILSRKSAEWSDQAVVQMKAGNRGVKVDLEKLTDEPAAPVPEVQVVPKEEPAPEVEVVPKEEEVPEVQIVPKEEEVPKVEVVPNEGGE